MVKPFSDRPIFFLLQRNCSPAVHGRHGTSKRFSTLRASELLHKAVHGGVAGRERASAFGREGGARGGHAGGDQAGEPLGRGGAAVFERSRRARERVLSRQASNARGPARAAGARARRFRAGAWHATPAHEACAMLRGSRVRGCAQALTRCCARASCSRAGRSSSTVLGLPRLFGVALHVCRCVSDCERRGRRTAGPATARDMHRGPLVPALFPAERAVLS